MSSEGGRESMCVLFVVVAWRLVKVNVVERYMRLFPEDECSWMRCCYYCTVYMFSVCFFFPFLLCMLFVWPLSLLLPFIVVFGFTVLIC